MTRFFMYLFWAFLISIPLTGQEVVFNKDSFMLGETVELLLKPAVEKPQDILMPALDFRHIRNLQYEQDTAHLEPFADVEITGYDTSVFKIQDSLLVCHSSEREGKVSMVFYSIGKFILNFGPYPPLYVTVISPAGLEGDISDIKPIVEVDGWLTPGWLWLAALMAGFILWLWYYLRKRKHTWTAQSNVAAVNLPEPWDEAIHALTAMKADKNAETLPIEVFQTKLTDVMRKYLQRNFHFNAFEMTSTEIMEHITSASIGKEQTENLYQLLNLSDMVKFAKAQPASVVFDQAIDIALHFVQKTKKRNVID
ncbi:MAG: hypothetical protein IPN29_14175 [Saprospiraceae bacterium]|nr:hypothetical protein [Saprospiraceae bacterium]